MVLEANDERKALISYVRSENSLVTLHAHAAIRKERQFKTATGEPIKHFREIERF